MVAGMGSTLEGMQSAAMQGEVQSQRGERERRGVAPQTRRMSKQGAACLELIIKK